MRGSGKAQVLGLPERPEPGKPYQLVVVLKHAGMKVAGFLLALDAGGGVFEAGSKATEVQDGAIRSTLAEAKQTDEAKWTLNWRAPANPPAEIVFYLSANAGNDDQSPFGDTIYLETVKTESK